MEVLFWVDVYIAVKMRGFLNPNSQNTHEYKYMRFNRFIFDNYLGTEEGKNILLFFENLPKHLKEENIEAIGGFINGQYLDVVSKENIIEFIKNMNRNIKNCTAHLSKRQLKLTAK
jgi:hypothetical protein